METTGHIVRVKNKPNAAVGLNDFVTMIVHADVLGAGVYDRLVELGNSVGEIRGGMPSLEPEDFCNARLRVVLEAAWALRAGRHRHRPERRRAGEAAREDQVNHHLEGADQGRVQGRDAQARPPLPDRADALPYAFANVEIPTIDVESHQGESLGDLLDEAW